MGHPILCAAPKGFPIFASFWRDDVHWRATFWTIWSGNIDGPPAVIFRSTCGNIWPPPVSPFRFSSFRKHIPSRRPCSSAQGWYQQFSKPRTRFFGQFLRPLYDPHTIETFYFNDIPPLKNSYLYLIRIAVWTGKTVCVGQVYQFCRANQF